MGTSEGKLSRKIGRLLGAGLMSRVEIDVSDPKTFPKEIREAIEAGRYQSDQA